LDETDLFQLIRAGDKVKLLDALDRADVNQVNEFGQSLLHEAIASGSTAIGFEMIRRKIDVNTQDSKGQTPLHYAALYGALELAKEILRNGCDLKILDIHGNSPLWTATFNARGNYGMVELLLEYGADPNHRNRHGRSPLDLARQINDHALILLLEGRGHSA
jgi:ankyrin repeat protein